jgi:hypothetical protein
VRLDREIDAAVLDHHVLAHGRREVHGPEEGARQLDVEALVQTLPDLLQQLVRIQAQAALRDVVLLLDGRADLRPGLVRHVDPDAELVRRKPGLGAQPLRAGGELERPATGYSREITSPSRPLRGVEVRTPRRPAIGCPS